MRKTKLLTLLLFTTIQLVLGQSEIPFTAQVGTFLNAKQQDFNDIKPLGYMFAVPSQSGLYRVNIGSYKTKASATKIVNQLIESGYPNAVARPQYNLKGEKVYAIQIATRNPGKKAIDWEAFLQVNENLHLIIESGRIKILGAVFSNIEDAKAQLPAIRNQGYKDAFITTLDRGQIHPVGAFELEGVKRPLIPIEFVDGNPANEVVPKGYDDAQAGNNFVPINTTSSLPNIRTKVKRSSVLGLQKFLKASQYYKGSLDGYYGGNTEKAFDALVANSRSIKKYQLLGQSMNLSGNNPQNLPLQSIINNLKGSAKDIQVLEGYNAPIANAYRAYLLYTNKGPSLEVNELMNAGVKGAYSTAPIAGLSPVDPAATYNYGSLEQIITHLLFVHSAPEQPYQVPCWLFSNHPGETAKANTQLANYPGFNYGTQTCDAFTKWEPIRTLMAVAIDLNGDKFLNANRMASDAAARNDLYLANRPLASAEQKALENWNDAVWNGLEGWSKMDPLHGEIVTSLKASYYQSYVLIEDYFMDNGLKPQEAKGLALAVLHTIVGYHLERFV